MARIDLRQDFIKYKPLNVTVMWITSQGCLSTFFFFNLFKLLKKSKQTNKRTTEKVLLSRAQKATCDYESIILPQK